MFAKDLISYIKIKKVIGSLEGITVDYISQDSRDVTKDTAFICIKGAQADGHDYVKSACEKGASLIIASEDVSDKAGNVPAIYVKDTLKVMALLANVFYAFPSEKLYMVGVTGTNGKTTIAHLIGYIFEKSGKKTGLMGTINHRIGDRIIPTKNTTPASLEVQKLLSDMVDASCDCAVMEVSSHALALDRVTGCNFDCAVFTNLTHEHMELHKTMENYAKTKERLFWEQGHGLKNGNFKYSVINIDDEHGKQFAVELPSQVITYAIKDASADFCAKNIKFGKNDMTFTLIFQEKAYEVKINLIGEFNVYNTLAAIATAFANGMQIEEVISIIQGFSGVGGRMQMVDEGTPYKIVIDFAHTPDGLENVLKTLKSVPHKKIITVIGHSGGNRDSSMRPELGKIALTMSDHVIFTADNPRGEKVSHIVEGLTSACENKNFETIEKREAAIEKAFCIAEADDIVLLAGKGVEPYQVIGDEYVPYSEIDVVKNILSKKKHRGMCS